MLMMHEISELMNNFLTVLAGIGLLFIIMLAIALMLKYKKKRKKSILFLGLSFIFFCVSILSALPIYLLPEEAFPIEKIFYGVAKIITNIALFFLLKFIIEIFYPGKQMQRRFKILRALFFISCLSLIIINYPIEIAYYLETGTKLKPPVISVAVDVLMSVPFIVLGILALQLSSKTKILDEKKALQLIGISSVCQAGFFVTWAINEYIAEPNLWTLPQWILVIAAAIMFFIGVTKPRVIFLRFKDKNA
ncbi:hypothetical protein GF325_01915 [Candidatus Bathyarchaeota archaeon]|nr:hypothetical protein [Candidatus Bathyarchaeota archaeon]